MQIYNIGQDELSSWEIKDLEKNDYVWFVYHYENGGYDGGGRAVALLKDGDLMHGDLNHCSCDGPINMGWSNAVSCSVDEYLAMTTDNIFDDVPSDPMKNKVRELLGL